MRVRAVGAAVGTVWLTSCAAVARECTPNVEYGRNEVDAAICREQKVVAWVGIVLVPLALVAIAWVVRLGLRHLRAHPRPDVWKPLAQGALVVAALLLVGNGWVWFHHRSEDRKRHHEWCRAIVHRPPFLAIASPHGDVTVDDAEIERRKCFGRYPGATSCRLEKETIEYAARLFERKLGRYPTGTLELLMGASGPDGTRIEPQLKYEPIYWKVDPSDGRHAIPKAGRKLPDGCRR